MFAEIFTTNKFLQNFFWFFLRVFFFGIHHFIFLWCVLLEHWFRPALQLFIQLFVPSEWSVLKLCFQMQNMIYICTLHFMPHIAVVLFECSRFKYKNKNHTEATVLLLRKWTVATEDEREVIGFAKPRMRQLRQEMYFWIYCVLTNQIPSDLKQPSCLLHSLKYQCGLQQKHCQDDHLMDYIVFNSPRM